MSHPSFPERVIIWKEGTLSCVDTGALLSFLREKAVGLRVSGPRLLWDGIEKAELEGSARMLAGSRVFRINSPLEEVEQTPFRGEIAVEERMILGLSEPIGMLYDAAFVARTYAHRISDVLQDPRLDPDTLHVVLTYRLPGTFESYDRRYHARTSYFAFPCIISITGLVVAPARPREYYFAKNLLSGGLSEEELLDAIRGRFLDHHDERTTDVLKGYLLQALFYHATGNPFCEDPSCMLFNAHWQEEMLHAQLGGDKDLCEKHESLLEG